MNPILFFLILIAIIFVISAFAGNDHRTRYRRYEHGAWRNGAYPPPHLPPQYPYSYEMENHLRRENEGRIVATTIFVIGLIAFLLVMAA